MSSIITNVGTIVRKWNDVSTKIKAAAAGGVTAGGVTSILAAVFPDWHPAAWVVGLITLGVALLAGYFKGDKVAVAATVLTTDAAGATTSTIQSFDLPPVPLVAELGAAIASQADVGGAEQEQPAGDEPKHLATSGNG